MTGQTGAAGATRITVEQHDGHYRTGLTSGLLRAQVVHSRPGQCRIGLLATTALLLGGDAVEVVINVGTGSDLVLFDVAGTTALDGRGRPASWHLDIRLEEDARLTYSGEPFVVADGADVSRCLDLELAAGATALVRDSLVLGRSGQSGGRVRNLTSVSLAGQPVLIEDQLLDAPDLRTQPGLLGDRRGIDTIMSLGRPARQVQSAHVSQFAVYAAAGTVTRFLGAGLAESPLHAEWRRLGRP